MNTGLDWVEQIRTKLAAVDAADVRLKEAMLIDSLPAEQVLAASEAAAALWDFVVTLPDNDEFWAQCPYEF